MRKLNLKNMSVDELVALFRQYALEQDDAMLSSEQAKINRLVFELKDIADELGARDGDQRSALLKLYNDPNSQVRVKAMKATLAIAPEKAIEGLRKLTENKRDPACLEAGMSLWAIEQGIFKPT